MRVVGLIIETPAPEENKEIQEQEEKKEEETQKRG